MVIKFKEIYEGWKNHILPEESIKDLIKEISEERLAICNNCEYHSKNNKTFRLDEHCTECGCSLTAKTKCLSCNCPLEIPKWTSYISREEELKIYENDSK